MSRHQEEHRFWQFELLISFHENADNAAAKELFSRLFHEKKEVFEPLTEYLAKNQETSGISILIELLGKMRNSTSAPLLLNFLKSKDRDVRFQSIIALGWLRARAALEDLDEIEARDPDEEIKREAGIAIEEILNDFPNMRDQLKFHQKIAIKRNPITMDSEEQIAATTPPSVEQRRSLVGMLPRMLAMKYRVVPLGIGPGGVVGLAVDKNTSDDPTEFFAKLFGRKVDLHGWPKEKIYERIISLYRWGDNDWVLFGENMSDEARKEITDLVLSGVHPAEPQTPLSECQDACEAVQSFFSICRQEQIKSAVIEYIEGEGTFEITLLDHHGDRSGLEAPPPFMKSRFMKAVELISNCQPCVDAEGETDSTILEGSIRHEADDTRFVAAVRSQLLNGVHAIGVEILELKPPDSSGDN